MHPLGAFQLSKRSGVPLRTRELVIDRTSARLGAEYEWGVHVVAFGAAAGLTEAQLNATVRGTSTDFAGADALVIEMVDQLIDTHTIDDTLWKKLAAEFSEEVLLELMVLCGFYHIIGFVLNGARIELEPWAARFPEG